MILRRFCWSIFLCLTLRQTTKAQVQIDEQGYQNVLISFAPNVPSENGKELVQSIQDLLESTSSVLHTAIGIRIASVTFLLPPSWSTEAWEDITVTPVSEQTARKPDISVDAAEHSPFGKQPVTLQHGGCGVAGHQINLPLGFALGNSSTEEYPKGKLLAREWLKYRYGVFDENGFSGDPLYPDYYRIPGSSEIRITECTNSEVTYIFKKPFVDEACDMELEDNFGSCKTHPESADNITSSLMYFHKDLPNMEHICGKDNPHHDTSRNKQNALCNGRSIWDVVMQSDDFKTAPNQSEHPVPETIQFSYVQESKPRFVVLLENSDNLHDQQESIRFALKRFYYDLPPKSKLAIYTYNSDVSDALPFTELPSEERSDIGIIADFGSPAATNICPSCGLAKAAEVLISAEVEKCSILLITASPLDSVPEFSEKLKESEICLRVLRFTNEDNSVDKTYNDLESSFHCFSQEPVQTSLDVVDIFHVLSRFLKNDLMEFSDNFAIKTVASGNMSAQNPVTISRDATSETYTLWLNRVLGSGSIECNAGDAVVELKSGITATGIASFTFAPMDADVTCRLNSAKQSPTLTQVQMTTQKGHYFDFDIWIHDMSTENEQLPIIIYAKIYFGGYPVKYAEVTTAVTSKDRQEIVKMLDNGRGDPDVTQYDGIYSGYFTSFLEAGNYLITVKMINNEGRAKIGKENPSLRSVTCCGSQVVSGQDEGVPGFEMTKKTIYVAKNKAPDDGYPPSRILDLQVQISNNSKEVTLSWTAPGGGKASSYEFYAFCDLEDCEDGKLPKWLKLNETETKPKSHGESEEVVFLLTEEVPKIERLPVFFAIKSVGEKGKVSDLSNKAEILLSSSPEPSTTAAPITNDGKKLGTSDPTGLIVGCAVIGALLLLCLSAVLYFYVCKPSRVAKPSDIDTNGYFQDKNPTNGLEVSSSSRATPTRDRGPYSMRRVESFPVLLYTHDQLKDFKKKVDPPLYKPTIGPRPWMSMNVLSNSELNKGNDSKSIGSASTLPMNDKHRSSEMKQLDDISLASETPQSEETIKF